MVYYAMNKEKNKKDKTMNTCSQHSFLSRLWANYKQKTSNHQREKQMEMVTTVGKNCHITGTKTKQHKMVRRLHDQSHFKNLCANKIYYCNYTMGKKYTNKHYIHCAKLDQTLSGCVSISKRIVLLFSRWEAMHQTCRSLDFKTCGWGDLVNHGAANWFSSLYLQNLAWGRAKILSLDAHTECNSTHYPTSTLTTCFLFSCADIGE